MKVLTAILISAAALGACAVDTSTDRAGICTISDCPEGVTLAQMRSQTVTEALRDGAPGGVSASCTGSGPGRITCWVDYFDFRTVCSWSSCAPDGSECDEFDECHTYVRVPPNMTPPPEPPASDPSICTISDCPEGVSLSQMRSATASEAARDGAPPSSPVGCTMFWGTTVLCHVDYFSFRTVCTWTDCTDDGPGVECETFSGCHTYIRD